MELLTVQETNAFGYAETAEENQRQLAYRALWR